MNYDLNMKKFWEVNKQCFTLDENIPRVPVNIKLNGDWICDLLKLDNSKYYTDFDYQQENRLRCSKLTEQELAYTIYPDIDFGVILDASIYGGQVNYRENATPTLQPVVSEPEEIKALIEKMQTVNLLEQGLVPKYLEWREKIKTRYGRDLNYGTKMKGCATMLGQILGITNFLTWIMTNPEEIRELITCWVETSIRYMQLMREVTGLPADTRGFSLQSDVTGMLSPSLYREFILEAEKRIYQTFAPGENDFRYYHSDYHMFQHLEALKEIGVNNVNIDPYITPAQILEKMPEVVIYGQIPPTEVLLYGSPEDVIECVKRDIAQAGTSRQLIQATAGSINPGTSFANLKAICYAVEKYGYVY